MYTHYILVNWNELNEIQKRMGKAWAEHVDTIVHHKPNWDRDQKKVPMPPPQPTAKPKPKKKKGTTRKDSLPTVHFVTPPMSPKPVLHPVEPEAVHKQEVVKDKAFWDYYDQPM